MLLFMPLLSFLTVRIGIIVFISLFSLSAVIINYLSRLGICVLDDDLHATNSRLFFLHRNSAYQPKCHDTHAREHVKTGWFQILTTRIRFLLLPFDFNEKRKTSTVTLIKKNVTKNLKPLTWRHFKYLNPKIHVCMISEWNKYKIKTFSSSVIRFQNVKKTLINGTAR
jgi:hypothetical protein